MSHDDFCRCTFGEFESICKAWRERIEGQNREAWERARTIAAIIIQPHLKKGSKITPQQLLPLPWDKLKTYERQKVETSGLTPAERQRRFEEALHRSGNET